MLNSAQVTKIKKSIGGDKSEQLPFMFSALGDAGRFRVFTLLTEHKDICVTDIANVLGISVPAASQQLKILEMSGLVRRERSGQIICYHLKNDNPVVKLIIKMLQTRL